MQPKICKSKVVVKGEQMANIGALRSALENRFDIPVGIRTHPPEESFHLLNAIAIPRGTLTEVRGAPSSGRTALLFAALARATRQGECCAWIDAAGAFDPESASRAGIPLDRLLWVNCGGDAEKALKAADLVIQAGGFGIVVFDLAGLAESRGASRGESMARRISLTSWFRLRHAAEQNHTALVALGDAMGEGPLTGPSSRLKFVLNGAKALWRGILLHGLRAAVDSRAEFEAVL